MAAKKKAAKAGAGAYAAGKAVRSNTYVQRLVEDEELRDNLRNAFDSARKAYARMSNGKGPVKAVTEDKKVQRELREAATSLKDAADSLRGGKRKKRGKGRLLLVGARRRGHRARRERGPSQEGARRAVRRRGGVRVHGEHHAGAEQHERARRRPVSAAPHASFWKGRPRGALFVAGRALA